MEVGDTSNKKFTPHKLIEEKSLLDIVDNLQVFQSSYVNSSMYEADEIAEKLHKIRSQVLDWNKRLTSIENNLKNYHKLETSSNISGDLWQKYVTVLLDVLQVVETIGFIRGNVIIGIDDQEEKIDENIKKITVKFVKINDKIIHILDSKDILKHTTSTLKNIDKVARDNLDVIEKDIDKLIDKMPTKYTEFTRVTKFSQYIRSYFYSILFIGAFIHHENYLNIISTYKHLEWIDIFYRIICGSVLANFRLNPFAHYKIAELNKQLILWILKNIPLLNMFVKSGEHSFLISNTCGFLYWAMWPIIYDLWMFVARLLVLTRAVIVTSTVKEYVNVIYDRYISGLTIQADITDFFNNFINGVYQKIKTSMYSEVSSYFDPTIYMGKISTAYCNNIDISLPYNLCTKSKEILKPNSETQRILLNLKADDVIKKSYELYEKYIDVYKQNQILTISCNDSCKSEWDSFEKILAKNMDNLGFMDIYQETYKSSPWVGYREYIKPDDTGMIVSTYLFWMFTWFVLIGLLRRNKYSFNIQNITSRKVIKKRVNK